MKRIDLANFLDEGRENGENGEDFIFKLIESDEFFGIDDVLYSSIAAYPMGPFRILCQLDFKRAQCDENQSFASLRLGAKTLY